jgi:hypothetical protein
VYTPGNRVGSHSIFDTSRYVDRSVAVMIIARLPGRMGAGAQCGQAKPSKSSGQMILEAPGRAWNGSGRERAAYFFASFFRFT